MLKLWRPWVLIILLVGPFVAYIFLGFLWLKERGWEWPLICGLLWVASGIVWQYLATRWTKSKRQILPPINWDAPQTFSEHDRKALELVADEAAHGEALTMQQFSEFDTYIEVGRRLARRLAAHYEPLAVDPVEHVPVVELLTALELATEDLANLCRQVPGGDLLTASHWKRAVQVSGYLQKANTIYSYLLPVFQPITGLPRLAAQKLMVQPSWKNMQQNLMRWFYGAFLNRLGTHLIELYSGRLSIGADQYRRLHRRGGAVLRAAEADLGPLVVAVAGARDSGKSRLIEALEAARSGDLGPLRSRLVASGLDEGLADRLKKGVRFVEVRYVSRPGAESARERSTRNAAVAMAAEADLLIEVVDAAGDDRSADAEFLKAWDAWFRAHPGRERPPALVVLTRADATDLSNGWAPPYQWSGGRGPREAAVRAKLDALKAEIPPGLAQVVAVGLPESGAPFGVAEDVLPAVAALLHRADRAHLLRHIQDQRARSKAGRFLSQLGHQGRRLWGREKGGDAKAG